eukprot:TRINITY_DN6667_c0_g1_i1.p1 TRINITY_DN6667_c0_g1~~TRINITY_DN6667_c0_g1_i1.p1  ORF type:complete len:92 (-),score=15.18 TRINITY_DN6667_c0_g1_i1:151-426(-)
MQHRHRGQVTMQQHHPSLVSVGGGKIVGVPQHAANRANQFSVLDTTSDTTSDTISDTTSDTTTGDGDGAEGEKENASSFYRKTCRRCKATY